MNALANHRITLKKGEKITLSHVVFIQRRISNTRNFTLGLGNVIRDDGKCDTEIQLVLE